MFTARPVPAKEGRVLAENPDVIGDWTSPMVYVFPAQRMLIIHSGATAIGEGSLTSTIH
jgi:hypothetical protein